MAIATGDRRPVRQHTIVEASVECARSGRPWIDAANQARLGGGESGLT